MKHLMVGRGTREFNTAQAMDEKYRRLFAYDCKHQGTHLDSRYFVASPQLARLTRCDSV